MPQTMSCSFVQVKLCLPADDLHRIGLECDSLCIYELYLVSHLPELAFIENTKTKNTFNVKLSHCTMTLVCWPLLSSENIPIADEKNQLCYVGGLVLELEAGNSSVRILDTVTLGVLFQSGCTNF